MLFLSTRPQEGLLLPDPEGAICIPLHAPAGRTGIPGRLGLSGYLGGRPRGRYLGRAVQPWPARQLGRP